MISSWSIWLEFGVCLVVITLAGSKLSRYGDEISTKSRFSGSWVGILFLAGITSLPELITGLSAAALAELPDIASGTIFGSCVFNLFILALIDLFSNRERSFGPSGRPLQMSAVGGALLIVIAALGLLPVGSWMPSLFHIGLTTPVIVLVYFLLMRKISSLDDEEESDLPAPAGGSSGLTAVWVRFSLAGSAVVAVALWLPFVAERIGDSMSWNQTFVGNLFVALATSLPEVVVTVAAARIGAHDMALGNVLGSNLFNVLVLAIDDLAYSKGILLADSSPFHLFSAGAALLMTLLMIHGLRHGVRKSFIPRLSWISLMLLAFYLANSILLFRSQG